ncbi:OsmC family protein [Micrococcoides hystricis]|uniref:OsmC family protein n=1 Tax=Micrococcoides hystricis TaxID=1572761 RepID=A0ABV6P8M8_9MICC
MSEIEHTYGIEMTRLAENHYVATNEAGAKIEFGRGEGLLSPVEVLLAAIAGCSSIDVDVVTARRSEATKFVVKAEGDRVNEDGASRLSAVRLEFDIEFPHDEAGQKAADMIQRVVQLSHDKHCTVARTVEHQTQVDFTVVNQDQDSAE